MLSKTQINKRTEKKRNPAIVRTIDMAKKQGLLELAKRLSGPSSGYTKVNVDAFNNIKEDKVMVVGKVLGQGEIEKKVSVAALGFSENAKEKLKKAGCDVKELIKEIEDNPKLQGVKIL